MTAVYIKSKAITTNGTRRVFEYKLWGDGECRVYRVHGDITSSDELAEAAQELALAVGAQTVKLNI